METEATEEIKETQEEAEEEETPDESESEEEVKTEEEAEEGDTVPHGALHAEREKRKDAERDRDYWKGISGEADTERRDAPPESDETDYEALGLVVIITSYFNILKSPKDWGSGPAPLFTVLTTLPWLSFWLIVSSISLPSSPVTCKTLGFV